MRSNSGGGGPVPAERTHRNLNSQPSVSPPGHPARDTPDIIRNGPSNSKAIPVAPPIPPLDQSAAERPRARDNTYVRASDMRAQTMARKMPSADDVDEFKPQREVRARSRDDLDGRSRTLGGPDNYGMMGRERDHAASCSNPVCRQDPNLGLGVPENTDERRRKQLKSPPKPMCVHQEIDLDTFAQSFDSSGCDARYRTLPAKGVSHAQPIYGYQHQPRSPPSALRGAHSPTPPPPPVPNSKTLQHPPKNSDLVQNKTQARGRKAPQKTVSFSEKGHPIIDLTREMPAQAALHAQRRQIGHAATLGPAMAKYHRGPENISGVIPHTHMSPPPSVYTTQRATPRVAFASGSPGMRRAPRQQSSTIDDILSPPFGHIRDCTDTASLPPRREKSVEKDEYGTAV